MTSPRKSIVHLVIIIMTVIMKSFVNIFIGPESDHWECLSLTDSLTDSLTESCLVNLIDVTLACEDANSKLVEIVADVDAKDRVGNSLLQIWELRFGHKVNLGSGFHHKVWSRF